MSIRCHGCGAPLDVNRLTCAYCGMLAASIDSPAKELAAVEELCKQSQDITQRSEGLMAKLYGGIFIESRAERVAAFWANAFSPTTLPACARMVTQILALVDTSYASASRQGTQKANESLIQKAHSLISSVKYSSPETELNRVALLEKEVNRTEAAIKRSRHKFYWTLGGSMLGLLAMNVVLFAFVDGINPIDEYAEQEKSCKGVHAPEQCDRLCRLAACVELCDAERNWACVLVDEMKATRAAGSKE